MILAAVFAAFAVYMAVLTNDHSEAACDRRYSTEQACTAKKEDKNLMLISGGVAVVFLVFGLIRRYPPNSRT